MTNTATTGGGQTVCDSPETPAQNVAAEGNTGAFGTVDAICFRLDFVPADFAGWGCSNFEATGGSRSIKVNGVEVVCGALSLPAPIDGGYYFDFGAGSRPDAAMYWWNWQ